MAHQLKGDMARLQEAGIFLDPNAAKVDFEKVMERVRKIRCQISHHDSATRYSTELGVEVFIGRARFTSERSVIVNGRTLHFKKAVIATIMAGLKESYDKANFAKGDLENRPILMTNEPFLI
jgi:pyruvate/2-oxoglutarate dehydrogenase complex dihydrolipoamide dehydrogenase (E3) component